MSELKRGGREAFGSGTETELNKSFGSPMTWRHIVGGYIVSVAVSTVILVCVKMYGKNDSHVTVSEIGNILLLPLATGAGLAFDLHWDMSNKVKSESDDNYNPWRRDIARKLTFVSGQVAVGYTLAYHGQNSARQSTEWWDVAYMWTAIVSLVLFALGLSVSDTQLRISLIMYFLYALCAMLCFSFATLSMSYAPPLREGGGFTPFDTHEENTVGLSASAGSAIAISLVLMIDATVLPFYSSGSGSSLLTVFAPCGSVRLGRVVRTVAKLMSLHSVFACGVFAAMICERIGAPACFFFDVSSGSVTEYTLDGTVECASANLLQNDRSTSHIDAAMYRCVDSVYTNSDGDKQSLRVFQDLRSTLVGRGTSVRVNGLLLITAVVPALVFVETVSFSLVHETNNLSSMLNLISWILRAALVSLVTSITGMAAFPDWEGAVCDSGQSICATAANDSLGTARCGELVSNLRTLRTECYWALFSAGCALLFAWIFAWSRLGNRMSQKND